ncbi:MAG: radical SAM protein [Pirellulales bacterium]|nr:radical SAM protein [Pirellulales bacterium]
MDEIHEFHNFGSKLQQVSLLPQVLDYVAWQQEVKQAEAAGEPVPRVPEWAPISINLDLTTACNYRCDHCIDWDILNSGVKHKEEELFASLQEMADRGLKSVILIGGGEPTVYPRFVDVVRYLKQELNQQVAVVSNGGRNDRILEAAEYFTSGDWVRLSLDSGKDETFQAMHKPRQPVTLDEICGWVPKIKDRNPDLQMGFSFIVTWKGAQRDDAKVVENINELLTAAQLAKQHRFDYISIKPFLIRAEENGSEVMDPAAAQEKLSVIIRKIKSAVDKARELEDKDFKVIESTNLKMLENGDWEHYTQQPKQCHMQFFRQVLTPHGVFNCPVYRSVPNALVAARNGYRDAEHACESHQKTGEIIRRFDAAHECREVTCLYNSANWWIQDLIERPEKLAELQATTVKDDYYL